MTVALADIQREAAEIGFSAMGITRPDAVSEAGQRLKTAIKDGHHASMDWLADRIEWRADPSSLWPEARSVIMLADAYSPDGDPLATLDQKDRATISVYARNRDYHDTVKKKLKRLGRWLIAEGGGEIKVFVDTAPVMEKPLAAAAGLGWQGKHTNLVSRELGNWVFLGAVFTTLDLEAYMPEPDHCGSCRACLDICPTNAFPAPYRLDAARCISYLTIEHKGPVDEALRPALGNRIYGCDDCLAACPWNKFAATAGEAAYHHRAELVRPRLADLATLTDESFRGLFSGSPIKRIGVARFLRNVLYAIGNSEDQTLLTSAEAHLASPDPVVADAARWAVTRLSAMDRR